MARDLGVKITEQDKFYFISYNSEDQDRVAEYVKELDSYGLPMWYDKGLHVGNKWESEISERIATCEAVIMFITRNIFSKDKSYVHKEYTMATDFFDKTIYLVYLDEIANKEIPHRYVSWWIDLQSYQGILAFNCSSAGDCAYKTITAIGIEPTFVEEKPKPDTEKIVTQDFGKTDDEKPAKPKKATAKTTTATTDTKTTAKKVTQGDYSSKDEIRFEDGAVYVGSVVKGKPDGFGKCTFSNGVCYEGEWKNGVKHGKGYETYDNGYFKGEWVDGNRTGYGEHCWKNGTVYVGDVLNGVPHGKGKLTLPVGCSYDGEWKNGKKHGSGLYLWPSGARYVGDFVDDERTGKGEYVFTDGSKYVGEFKNGQFNGAGKFTDVKGKTSSGNWKDGKQLNS